MALSLAGLPRELLLHIYSFLTPHDLAHIASASKSLGTLAEILIWDDIELHAPGYHESSCELKDPPPVVPPEARRYHSNPGTWAYGGVLERKAASLFWMLDLAARSDLPRVKLLLSRVRSLCTVLDWMNCPDWVPQPPKVPEHPKLEFTWSIFPLFSNLERLELHGSWEAYWDGHGRAFDSSAPPLAALRSVKLFGYLPGNVVRYILRSAPTIENLQLGVLDAPVGCNLAPSGRRQNPPPRRKGQLESDEDGDDETTDDDSLDGDEVAPRPLPLFHHGEMPAFPRLKLLHLCKPSQCDPAHYGNLMLGDVTYSQRSEEASLSDWSGLLRAAQGTLETLVLEHRVVAEYIEGDGMSMREFIEACSCGPAEDHFMDRIVPVFKEKAFANLRSVHMHGILVSAKSTQRRKWFRKFWEDYGVECSFSYGQWCYFDSSPGTTYWASYEGHSDDEDEDEDEGQPDGPED
ncbi:hypothetical protein BKA67DRAFT_107321 [Truncatella angustata]|uniref:F-box domain-containing protein n=1 Tax=Truncatella angustata TaxID=152316 RepID=A0A9P8RJI7_9PEZI|nr:uncharacterized protein BKA67DRAFT_107321 [Truncatella angustata]KAH6645256.1 hypothetical protein BKA67DRAFT_107321 [Truncatella angustata]KAH8200591.1 hypothetical protein TruAng_005243 [Truncatella angustata]